MPFDLLGSLLGWGVKAGADGILRALAPSELSSRMRKTIADWAKSLPDGYELQPEAILQLAGPEAGPAQQQLRAKLLDACLPTADEWHSALIERWKTIAGKGGSQNFFLRSEQEASRHLRELALRLTEVCQSDSRIFLNTFAGAMSMFKEWQESERRINDIHTEHASLIINDLEEPPDYSASYTVGFYVHNSTRSELLIDRLRAEVCEFHKIDQYRAIFPGAPAVIYPFTVHLQPEEKAYSLQGPHKSFSLKPNGDTELFRAVVGATRGYDYQVRMLARETHLASGRQVDISTPKLWLSFKGTGSDS
jgi:hypothetical protein